MERMRSEGHAILPSHGTILCNEDVAARAMIDCLERISPLSGGCFSSDYIARRGGAHDNDRIEEQICEGIYSEEGDLAGQVKNGRGKPLPYGVSSRLAIARTI